MRKEKITDKKVYLILFCIILLNIFFLNLIFPINILFNDKPIVTDDYPTKLYNAMGSRELLLDFKIIDFDENTFVYRGLRKESDKLFSLLSVIFFFIPIVYLFKFYIFFLVLLIPLIYFFIGKNLGLKDAASLILSILSVLLIYFDWNMYGMIYWGIYSYLLSISISLFALSYLFKHRYQLNIRKIIIFTFLCILSILSHILSIFTLFIFLSLPLFYNYRKIISFIRRLSSIQIILLFLLIIIILILSHIFLFQAFFKYSQNYEFSTMAEAQNEGFKTIYWDYRYSPVKISIYLIGSLSMLYLMRIKYRRDSLLKYLLAGSILLFIIGYFGSFVNVVQYLNPRRFTSILAFILLIPISIYIGSLLKNRSRKKMIFSLFILIIFIFYIGTHSSLIHKYRGQQLSVTIPSDTDDLLEWVEDNTDISDTILIEGSSNIMPNKHVYGGHISALFHLLTNRSYIVNSDISHRFHSDDRYPFLKDGKLNEKPLSDDTIPLLEHYIENHGIDWIVIWSDPSKDFFSSNNISIYRAGFGRLEIYEVI